MRTYAALTAFAAVSALGCGQPTATAVDSAGLSPGQSESTRRLDPQTRQTTAAGNEVALDNDDPPASPSSPAVDADDERPTAPAEPEHPFVHRIRAPELSGGVDWINAGGPIELKDLRGKFVLLDFWTYCCINCMHILPELKKLEQAYPNELVVIGVHSAKFDTEEDSKNIAEAVQRYNIEHPVVNDANHAIWDRYGVRSWPTMLLIDPEGNAVYARSGEFQFEELDAVLKRGLPHYRRKGVLDETPLHFALEADRATPTPLRYPGKILADADSRRLFIADSNHNRIVIADLDGKLIDIVGSGKEGADDGGFAEAAFKQPQGMALRGETLYVADTENHLLRKIDLAGKTVTTIAGTGQQGRSPWLGIDLDNSTGRGPVDFPERWIGKPRETAINSPWDVLIHGDDLYIAMAGPHQIWKMPLDEAEIGPYAGNAREDIVDGPLMPREPYAEGYSSFAQPSGLATDGKELFVADSEGSSIRAVPFDPAGQVRTLVGTAHLPFARLFTFGDEDGQGIDVRLQHALAVAWLDGAIYLADTYNNKIKRLDPVTGEVTTIAGTGEAGADDQASTFDEPAGLAAAANRLYVADTNNHLIRVIDLADGGRVSTLPIEGLAPPEVAVKDRTTQPPDVAVIDVPETTVRPSEGRVAFDVAIALPEGFKINQQAPLRWRIHNEADSHLIDASVVDAPISVDDPAAKLALSAPLSPQATSGVVRVTLPVYYCRDGAEGVCKAGALAWRIPIRIADDAEATAIELRGSVN